MVQLSPALMFELENRLKQLQNDDKYMKELTNSINLASTSGASGINDANVNDPGHEQLGTTVPKYFGAIDTFVVNPSNVSIGIMARMIETDPTIFSSVQFKSLMMLSKIGDYQNKNPELKKFVDEFTKAMQGPTWREALEAQSSHYGYGFSITEILWGINKNLKKVPMRLDTYHPSTICFELDHTGHITQQGIIQFTIQNGGSVNPNISFPYFKYGYTVTNPFETPNDKLMPYRLPFIANYGLARIPRNKVIHHKAGAALSFGSPYGKTAVRAAHLAWQMKVFFLKRLGIAGKRSDTPMIWGTAPMSANKVKVEIAGKTVEKTPIQVLTSILAERESGDSVVTGPKEQGYHLEAIAMQMDLNQHLAVLNWLDTQMFRAFLLPSLVMTDGSAGSRSLGDKHFQLVDFIAGEEAQKFGENIINELIKPAIIMNFGEQEDYGHFSQRPQSVEERERLANMFTSLANGGWMSAYDPKDGEYVRSSLHLPAQEKSFYAKQMPLFTDDQPGEGDQDPGADPKGNDDDDVKDKPPKESAE